MTQHTHYTGSGSDENAGADGAGAGGGRLRPLVTMSADHQTRVRVGVPNSELLADATTVKKEINEVGVGSFNLRKVILVRSAALSPPSPIKRQVD